MAESFPNSENAFRDAFRDPDPIPKLLELIIAHPRPATIVDLISVYEQLVGESPTQINKLAGLMVEIHNFEEVTIVSDNPERGIASTLNRTLASFHNFDLALEDEIDIAPSNNYLLGSLLSATSMIYGLTTSSAQGAAVLRGLQLEDRRLYQDTPELKEIFVLGTCLQLLIAGSYLYGPTGIHTGRDDVLTALQDVKAEGLVKNPNGQRLLEAAIRQAKDGFKTDMKGTDAWNILFPQEA
ncbi:hypothetical protein M413DRAFT_275838 [Hebeloma cylindrosporum]|uniref:Uncharacterized protein n=1 Tax=Hebeloma cylindrosporum TaxID=76867 RepID=A0A0C3BLA7_HEBCY|nr:hypothetical protein M413DRAFT_275838 [Hebeloma cylindrosporum h7]